MSSERMEWVEIIEPKTQEHMYANLRTGECVWDLPLGVPVKKRDDNQWWELFDSNTSRFYYYNATTQKTVWHRPTNCDIIPLAKLQTLKQHAEALCVSSDPEEHLNTSSGGTPNNNNNKTPPTPAPRETVATQTSRGHSGSSAVQTAHVTSIKSVNSTNNHISNNFKSSLAESKTKPPPSHQSKAMVTCETQTSPLSPRRSHHHHHHHHKRSSNNNNIKPAQSQDSGRSSDSNCSTALPLSSSTPLLKKKETFPTPAPRSIQRSASNAVNPMPVRQKSFDTNISIGGGYSLGHENRCGSMSRTPRNPHPKTPSSAQISRSQSFAQGGVGPHSRVDREEDDSMHEKYFLKKLPQESSHSTPQSRRKHLPLLHQSPAPDYVNFNTPPPPSSHHSRSSSNSSTMQTTISKQLQAIPYQKSPNKLSSRLKESGVSSSEDEDRSSSLSLSSSPPTAATPPRRKPSPSPLAATHLSDTNLDLSLPSNASSERKQHNCNDPSPLYTNTSQDEHMLPLHQYILEQAKLSGCYRFGDPLYERNDASSLDGDTSAMLGGLRVEYDSDEFADDEAMSAAEEEDSSSQEYLDEDDNGGEYLHEEYAARFRRIQSGGHGPQSQSSSSKPYNFTHADGGRMCDYTIDDGSGASSHYYNTTASLLRPSQMGLTNQYHHHHHQTPQEPTPIPLETQHASLKKRKDPLPSQPIALYSPILEARSEQQMPRALDKDLLMRGRFTPLPQDLDGTYAVAPGHRTYERSAPDNLNIHKKGLFRKNLSVKDMLSWSTDPISQPMTVLPDKSLKKEARDLFKLVQIYMGDRKTKVGMSSNSVALEICTRGYSKPALRDELYIQICKQTSENPKKESLRRGWELMAIALAFFPPSPRLQSYLDSYMNRHRNPNYDFPEVGKWPIHIQVSHYATVACKRLERGGMGGKRPPRKPSVDEIEQAKLQIFRPSMFGSTLAEVMSLQRDKFPHHRLPWIQTTLSEQVLRLGGKQTEGIFRVSADMDEVTCLKLQLDRWDLPQSPLLDAHTPASLLKLWYRELYEPLIPDTLYTECVTHCESPSIVLKLVDRLPELNRMVLCYLIHFLQMFAKQDVVQMTKMDANNLAMVMAPNCLRCTSSDPHVIFDNARKEMAFMRTLIQHLDTNFIEKERVF